MASARRRGGRYDWLLDVGVWLLFVLLLVPAGVVGYAIGKDQADDEPARRKPAAPHRRRAVG